MELQASGFLTVVAEIAIALAGFAGLIVAMRQRGIETLLEHEAVRLKLMLGIACATLFFALFPHAPHYAGLDSGSTWNYSSLLFGLGLAGMLVISNRMIRPVMHLASRFWLVLYNAGTFLSAALLFTNTRLFTTDPTPAVYVVGLGWMLFYSTSLFVRLVLAPVRS